MPVISIRERGITSSGPVVAIDDQEYPIPKITSPFDDQAEAQLAWYFEEHLRFPFTNQVRAQEAATSIGRYGEALFEQVLGERRIFGRYQTALQEGIDKLAFEIAGAPEFQQLHWEALKDPDLPQPFALHTPFVRRNLSPRPLEAKIREAPTINVLVVTARPGAGRDVGYRTISRPLVAALRQAGTPVTVGILRPGSYAALAAHLAAVQDNQGAGYYHVIHFDVHGALLTFPAFDALGQKLATSRYTFQPQRYGRPKLPHYEGVKAFLFLESGAPEVADPVEAAELAKLLLTHQIPIAILNACQSGKQVGASETSLGSQLMSAGMQMVLAMGYSVTVSAAETMMGRLYQGLFQSGDLAAAIRSARLELSNARTYYQLGRVAQEQRQWEQSKQHYQQAIAIFIEFNDRYEQAGTYGQIGLLMQQQEHWNEAARALVQALVIFAEFEDEHYTRITISNLRSLYQAHPEGTMLNEIATALGMTVEAARAWITTTGP